MYQHTLMTFIWWDATPFALIMSSPLSSLLRDRFLKENISNVCRDRLINSIADWTPTQSDESVVLWFLTSAKAIN